MLRFPDASHWITATHFFLFERICSVFCAIWQSRTPFSQQVNGHAPFFRANFSVFRDIERICSVFYAVFEPFSSSKVGGLNRSEWVDMLRFRHTYKMFLGYRPGVAVIGDMIVGIENRRTKQEQRQSLIWLCLARRRKPKGQQRRQH